ncbi:hypothetical protein [Rheinheimera sp.]|uniref:hypothetical protein n=1 Tax=Rheinheimera sp. TaxID=1869214 RepID=UPI0025FAF6F7|nr:hypothetical protein [Rheinheimera sp.]
MKQPSFTNFIRAYRVRSCVLPSFKSFPGKTPDFEYQIAIWLKGKKQDLTLLVSIGSAKFQFCQPKASAPKTNSLSQRFSSPFSEPLFWPVLRF